MQDTYSTSNITNQQYAAAIRTLIGTYAKKIEDGDSFTVDDLVSGLEPSRAIPNAAVRKWASENAHIKVKEFDAAMHRKRVSDVLGSFPATATQYVAIEIERRRLSPQFNGSLSNENGSTINAADFLTALRVKSVELGLPFRTEHIADAYAMWLNDRRDDLKAEVFAEIDYVPDSANSLADLMRFCFDGDADFNAAVLMKFMWQVKRKMAGLPITDHLMPVLLGPQGCGKSTLIGLMVKPVEAVMLRTDFKEMTDGRHIDLWRNYVLFLDEMPWASKSDIDTVKNIITAPFLTRRPMNSNTIVMIPQNATLIGASNAADLAEVIRDTTGNRRFMPLTMKRHPDHAAITSFGWREAWRSVDHSGPDPLMSLYMETVLAVQASHKAKSPIEEWLDQLDRFERTEWHGNTFYQTFRTFEDECFPGSKTTIQKWGRELKAMMDDGKLSWLAKKAERGGTVYCAEAARNITDLDTMRLARR